MADKVVSDNFNIYDIFGRFGPGCIYVACLFYCYRGIFLGIGHKNKYMILIVYVSLSYIFGSINQALVRWFISKRYNKHYFGGNPREIFTFHSRPDSEQQKQIQNCSIIQRFKKKREYARNDVLKHEGTRDIARCIRDFVSINFNIEELSTLQKDKEYYVKKADFDKLDAYKKANHFAFGYMTNYLDIKGYSSKNSRINSLADMCASVAVTTLLCDITCAPLYLYQMHKMGKPCCDILLAAVVILAVSVFIYFSSRKLYRSYIQMRYAIVVYQFAIIHELFKEYLRKKKQEEALCQKQCTGKSEEGQEKQ